MTKAHFLKSPVAILVGTVLLVPAAQAVTDTTVPVTGHPPVVAPKLSTLTPNTGDSVSVSPNFTDPDGDAEDTTATGTAYQWQVEGTAGSGNYTDITGQTGKDYIIQATDRGKKLRVMVTPRTAPTLTEPFTGQPTASDIAQVTGAPDAAHSTLTVTTTQANNTITADDGTSTDVSTKATLTLTLHDAQDKPVKGQTPTFAVTPVDPGVKISAVKDNLDGTYTATLTGTKARDYTAAPELTGTAFGTGQAQLSGKVSITAAALDGPTSKVDIPVDAALEGNSLNVVVHLRDRFDNIIDPVGLAQPDFIYSSGEKLNPSYTTYHQYTSYMLRPSVVNAASRKGTLTIVMPDGTVIADTQKSPRPLRWTPLMVIKAVGVNGRTTMQCNASYAPALGCPVYIGAQVRIVSADTQAGLSGGSTFIPQGFTVKNAKYTNMDSSGVVQKSQNTRMSAEVTLQDSLTGVSQKVSGFGALYVAYGYKQWSSTDSSGTTASAAARELCSQVGASGSGFYSYMGQYYGSLMVSGGRFVDGPRVNTYGGGHDTRMYSGFPSTSERGGWWSTTGSVTASAFQIDNDGSVNEYHWSMGQFNGPSPYEGSICEFN
ncbi:hypothetical protein K3J84_004710 [Salmonella enterica]|nr:hypothetical protein [Salmonella enterica subsp. enterica serovar Oslo]EHW8352241.1 hypothetical protein [Salmonella enterica]EHW8353125.1 hypothetical protein [Salmonella enterica]